MKIKILILTILVAFLFSIFVYFVFHKPEYHLSGEISGIKSQVVIHYDVENYGSQNMESGSLLVEQSGRYQLPRTFRGNRVTVFVESDEVGCRYPNGSEFILTIEDVNNANIECVDFCSLKDDPKVDFCRSMNNSYFISNSKPLCSTSLEALIGTQSIEDVFKKSEYSSSEGNFDFEDLIFNFAEKYFEINRKSREKLLGELPLGVQYYYYVRRFSVIARDFSEAFDHYSDAEFEKVITFHKKLGLNKEAQWIQSAFSKYKTMGGGKAFFHAVLRSENNKYRQFETRMHVADVFREFISNNLFLVDSLAVQSACHAEALAKWSLK